ncbi:hypothetical protein [Nostoc linckia]|nr:hypothetical protein [Nostoc linckia]
MPARVLIKSYQIAERRSRIPFWAENPRVTSSSLVPGIDYS